MGGTPSLSRKENLDLGKFETEQKRPVPLIPLLPSYSSKVDIITKKVNFNCPQEYTKETYPEIWKNENYGILPINVLHQIFLYCSPTELYTISTCCKLFYVVWNNQYFWKSYSLNFFSLRDPGEQEKVENWKKYFFENFYFTDSYYRWKYRSEDLSWDDVNSPLYSEFEKDLLEYKFSVFGEEGSGRNSFISRLCYGSFGDEEMIEKVRKRAFHPKTLSYESNVVESSENDESIINKKQRIRINVWTNPRQERYRNITPMWYRGSVGAMIMFSIDDQESFRRSKQWVKEFQRMGRRHGKIILCGTKCDLEEGERKVFYEEDVKKYLDEQYTKFPYVEISSKRNKNVDKAFGILLDLIIEEQNKPTDEQEYASLT